MIWFHVAEIALLVIIIFLLWGMERRYINDKTYFTD